MGIANQWRELRRFSRIPREELGIVFYSEGPAYWGHFEPVISYLTNEIGERICYITSSADDPGYSQDNPRIRSFLIGDGLIRTIFFKWLECSILVMTMTELSGKHIQRSPLTLHYVYLFHSLVSTHMVFKTGAFDHYDTLFCCGPYHVQECREHEKIYGIPPRRLIEHGYGRLDTLLKGALQPRGEYPGRKKRVLVAPSWGPEGVFETGRGEPLVKALLQAGYQVSVRAHPHFIIRRPDAWKALIERFRGEPDFSHETDVTEEKTLYAADVMISDWSGAALEFALALEKPVLFIDVPRKVNNPEYQKLPSIPFEVMTREQLGLVLLPDAITDAPALIEKLLANPDAFAARARSLREEYVFNPGQSGRAGAEAVKLLLKEVVENGVGGKTNVG